MRDAERSATEDLEWLDQWESVMDMNTRCVSGVLRRWITRAQQLEARVMELTYAAQRVSNSTIIDEEQAEMSKVQNVFVTTFAHNVLRLREILAKEPPK